MPTRTPGTRTPTAALLSALAITALVAACSADRTPFPTASGDAVDVRRDPGVVGTGGTGGATPEVAPERAAGVQWVGVEHNRGMSALVQEGRQRPRAATEAATCDAALRSVRRYLMQGHVRGDDGRPLLVAPAAVEGYLQIAIASGGCGDALAGPGAGASRSRRSRSLLDVEATARAIAPDVPALSPAARGLIAEMQGVITRARASADVATGFDGIEARTADLAPTERTVLRAGLALGRASAVFAFDSVKAGRGRGATLAAADGIGRFATDYEEGGGKVIEADITGCMAGALMGAIGGGPVGALTGCAVGGLGASLAEIFREMFW